VREWRVVRHTQDDRVWDSDRVERDIDAARLVDHGLEMLVHGLLVESVDLGRFGGSAGGNDVLGYRFDGRLVAPGEKELRLLGRKGACDSTADRASGSVEHRNLVLQHHLRFLSPGCRFRRVLVETPTTPEMERRPR
jgi:hypothetical protein